MALEEIKAQIALLFEEMVNQPEDEHEVLERLREKLNELRAMGMPLPDDLVAAGEAPRRALSEKPRLMRPLDNAAAAPATRLSRSA